jgi:hypothetical protein
MRTRVDNKNFDDFVRRQQQSSVETETIDWDKQRKEWLRYLDELYSTIESFLREYTSAGQIKIGYQDITLDEENLGSYSARKMILRIGRQEVFFLPVGTLLIGAKGRVDMIGPGAKAQMLLVDKRASWAGDLIVSVEIAAGGKSVAPSESPRQQEIEWEWRILSRPPERRFVEITRQSLFDLIMEVANG